MFALPGTVRDVRFGSKADIAGIKRDVRFTPESGHAADCSIDWGDHSECES
jgi:hypothetical protein